MINRSLLKQSIKANWVLWLVTTLGVGIMLVIINVIVGKSGIGSSEIDQLTLAQYYAALDMSGSGLTVAGLFQAFGIDPSRLEQLGTMDLNLAIHDMFYTMAGLLLPILYVVVTGNKLVAAQVDRGSMAYILSSPIKRKKVIFTQITFLIGSLFSMYTLLFAMDVVSQFIGYGEVNVGEVLLMNLGGFITILSIAGIAFFASSLFNLSRHSLALGGGLAVFFFLTKIMGLFGSDNFVNMGFGVEEMRIFNYMTIISLFDTASISALSYEYIWKFAIMLAVAIIAFVTSVIVFDKKDLPL